MKTISFIAALYCTTAALSAGTFQEYQTQVTTQFSALQKKHEETKSALKAVQRQLAPIVSQKRQTQDAMKKNKQQLDQVNAQVRVVQQQLDQLKKLAADGEKRDKAAQDDMKKYDAQAANVGSEARRILTEKQIDLKTMQTSLQAALGRMDQEATASDQRDATTKMKTEIQKLSDGVQSTATEIDKKLIELAAPIPVSAS
ncbi:hypothetical protein EBZ39_17455 [bacterium]|nr:hypothetical protein [bacterium]